MYDILFLPLFMMRKTTIIPAVVFALLCNFFFYRSSGVLGVSLFFLLFFLYETVVFFRTFRQRHIRVSYGILGIFLLLFLGNAVMTDSSFIIFTQSAASCFVLGLLYYLGSAKEGIFGSVMEFVVAPFRSSGCYMQGFFGFLGALFSKTGEMKQTNHPAVDRIGQWVRPVVVGFCIGLPVILLMFGLLVSADPIFKKTVLTLKLPSLPQEFAGRMWLTGMVFLLSVPFVFSPLIRTFSHPFTYLSKLHIIRELTVVVAMVGALLLTFLIIQAPYVFASVPFETDLTRFGVATYSEYVRKGFGELLFVVFIVYGVLWLARIAKGLTATPGERKAVRLASGILFGLTVIFILSIARRVYLYQAYHGWSLIRIYGLWLLLWISALLATLGLRDYKKPSIPWVNIEILLSLCWVAWLGMFNAELFIVRTHPPTVNKRIDYIYLSRLSADGYDGWKEAYGFARKTLIDKNLLQQPIIKMEDRRDVAYSIAIVAKLTQQYQRLLQIYGTEEEKKEFVRQFLEVNQKDSRRFLQTVDLKLAGLEAYTAGNEKAMKDLRDSKNYEERIVREVEESLQLLDANQLTFEQGMMDLLPNFSFWQVHAGDTFFTNSGMYAQRRRTYWFAKTGSTLPRIRQKTALDRMYLWSGSSFTYEHMKREIPFSELIALNDAFISLFEKISNQPENDRTYQSDVSLNSPFVQ